MSRDDDDDVEAILEPLPPDRTDGAMELGLRATVQMLFNDPSVRNFTFAALGALGMIFLILFQQASDIGGLLIVIVGVCGLLLRWSAAPVFVLILLTYFMVFPFGIPEAAYENPYEIEEGRFRVTDLMLVMAVVVYLACQYRIFGFVSQAVAFEGVVRRKDETPARRPPALIRSSEIGIMFAICFGFVVLGQFLWLFANSIEVVPVEDFPLRWADSGRTIRDYVLPGGMNTGTTRFVVLVGFLFFGTILARLVFGYWRLRMMSPSEGGMMLLDGGWSETSRERQRWEAWRIWGLKREDTQAKSTPTSGPGGKT